MEAAETNAMKRPPKLSGPDPVKLGPFSAPPRVETLATSLLPEGHSPFKGHTQSCPLSSVSAASVIHQNLAHEPGGHAKKMRPILPMRSVLFHKPQVGLVYEGRRLEGMAVAFFAEIAGC